jgi:hypothetical protein
MNNRIGAEGAQHLASALQKNTVRLFLYSLSQIDWNLATQTLTTLTLAANKIDEEGAQHLAIALKQNRVRSILSFSLSNEYALFNTDTHYARYNME